MSNYLFIVQNDTHAKNFSYLISELDDVDILDILVLDNITKTKTVNYLESDAKNNKINFIHIPSFHKDAFYLTKNITRIKIVKRISNFLKKKSIFNKYDYIYIGNDGAIQKLILGKLKKSHKTAKVILIVDGFLNVKHGILNKIKRKLSLFFSYFQLSHYFPSEIGCYNLNDEIWVMHDSVKNVLIQHGVCSNKIKVSILPRHTELVKLKEQKVKNNENNYNVVYMATAYKWHSLEREHKKQIKQIEALKKFLPNDFVLTVRMHPRDDIKFYPEGFFDENLKISKFSLEDDLISNHWVITSRSSAIFDAMLVGCNVLIYNQYFEDVELGEQFSDVPICQNIAELINYMKNG